MPRTSRQYFDRMSVGSRAKSDLARTIDDDIDVVFVGMGDKMSQFCTACFRSLASYNFAVLRGWQIALVFALMYPFLAFGGCLVMSAPQDNMQETHGWCGPAGKCASEMPSQIRTVVSCGAEEAEYDLHANGDSVGWRKAYRHTGRPDCRGLRPKLSATCVSCRCASRASCRC